MFILSFFEGESVYHTTKWIFRYSLCIAQADLKSRNGSQSAQGDKK